MLRGRWDGQRSLGCAEVAGVHRGRWDAQRSWDAGTQQPPALRRPQSPSTSQARPAAFSHSLPLAHSVTKPGRHGPGAAPVQGALPAPSPGLSAVLWDPLDEVPTRLEDALSQVKPQVLLRASQVKEEMSLGK